MKVISLVILATLSCLLSPLQAGSLEGKPLSLAFEWPWFSNLQGEINHLNRMVGHVRWQFTRYRSDRSLQRDYWQIRHEVDRLNAEFKRASYNKGHMRSEIERLRGRLHDIETRLRVKKVDYYRWR